MHFRSRLSFIAENDATTASDGDDADDEANGEGGGKTDYNGDVDGDGEVSAASSDHQSLSERSKAAQPQRIGRMLAGLLKDTTGAQVTHLLANNPLNRENGASAKSSNAMHP